MKRALVAIGVDAPASGFPPLRAAALGAREMAVWGKQQGFDVTPLSDDGGKKVSLHDVFDAINAVVAAKVYSQLVVYFSGHGILLSPDAEVWLLSDAIANPNEAINVSGSIVASRASGIPHIVFVSDACRSMPSNFRLGMVAPGLIFPISNPKTPLPEVDVFYATLPGDPALEVPPDEAEKSFRGLLTTCMLKALAGVPTSLVERVTEAGAIRRVVASRPLKSHLIRAVPDAASAISIKLKQDPDVRVESALPKYLAELAMSQDNSEPVAPQVPPATTAEESELVFRGILPHSDSPRTLSHVLVNSWSAALDTKATGWRGELEIPDFGDVKQSVQLVLESVGRNSFETGTGFSVYGVPVRYAKTTGPASNCEVWEEAGAFQIRVHPEYNPHIYGGAPARAILLRFKSGTGIVLSVLPGFIGTVVTEKGAVVTVNYTPSRGTENHLLYEGTAPDINQRRAFVAVAAKNGSFRLDQEAADGTARYLRSLKKFDPTLGLYAAYAYVQAGNADGVVSIYRYMKMDPEPVLFDVGMLAAQRDRKLPQVLDYAPWMPMLTQGWLLLGEFEELMPDVLREARKHLIPGLWTTFSAEGMDILEEAMFGGVGS